MWSTQNTWRETLQECILAVLGCILTTHFPWDLPSISQAVGEHHHLQGYHFRRVSDPFQATVDQGMQLLCQWVVPCGLAISSGNTAGFACTRRSAKVPSKCSVLFCILLLATSELHIPLCAGFACDSIWPQNWPPKNGNFIVKAWNRNCLILQMCPDVSSLHVFP